MAQTSETKTLAIIGAGISGITAAYVLAERYPVTLFERSEKIGGHTNTRIIEMGPDAGTAVDTGFIVCNPKTYPNFYKLLARLGVSLRDSHMSFGFSSEESGLAYVGPLFRDFIRHPTNLLRIDCLRMIRDIHRFNRCALADLEANRLTDTPLGEYTRRLGLSETFIDSYLLPIVASIWSSPDNDALNFPLATFATFFRNHGMLRLKERPQWQTVVGGSHTYLRAFERDFRGTIRTSSPVQSVRREPRGVEIRLADGTSLQFDAVIFASHADETLAMLEDPSGEESALLGRWRYTKNHAILHTDTSVAPPNRSLWAAWNYRKRRAQGSRERLSISYYMNLLQGLKAKEHYFVTLNGQGEIDPEKILYEITYTHPVYTADSVKSQTALRGLNGQRNTFFCGAHLRYGFHEDGVCSGLDVARHFGCHL